MSFTPDTRPDAPTADPSWPIGADGQTSLPRPPDRSTRVSQQIRRGPGRWIATGATAAVCAGLAGYLYLVDPNNPANAYPQCPMKALTGLDCPGCGGLRATHSLVHGDIVGALHHNVVAFAIIPVIAYLITRWVFGLWGRELPPMRLPGWAGWAIPLAMLVFSIVRNIPNTPFYALNSGSA